MQPITRKELLEKLEELSKKEIRIKTEGYINIDIILNKYEIEVIDDEINLKTINFNNKIDKISFNLNEVRNMEIQDEKILINIDDERESRIEISLK